MIIHCSNHYTCKIQRDCPTCAYLRIYLYTLKCSPSKNAICLFFKGMPKYSSVLVIVSNDYTYNWRINMTEHITAVWDALGQILIQDTVTVDVLTKEPEKSTPTWKLTFHRSWSHKLAEAATAFSDFTNTSTKWYFSVRKTAKIQRWMRENWNSKVALSHLCQERQGHRYEFY